MKKEAAKKPMDQTELIAHLKSAYRQNGIPGGSESVIGECRRIASAALDHWNSDMVLETNNDAAVTLHLGPEAINFTASEKAAAKCLSMCVSWQEQEARNDLLADRIFEAMHWFTTLDATTRKRNSENARNERPNSRNIHRDEIEAEFLRLTAQGHTRREANGLLFSRGLATRPTISKITKSLQNDNTP